MRSTPLPRAAAASIVASAALGAFAAPASAVIALAPVRPCLSELDAVSPNASGLTPAGPVKLDLLSNGRLLLSTSSQPAAADGTYRIAKPYPSTVTDKWFPDQGTETIPLQMNVTDLTRVNGGAPAASPEVAATASVTFSRWNVFIREGERQFQPLDERVRHGRRAGPAAAGPHPLPRRRVDERDRSPALPSVHP